MPHAIDAILGPIVADIDAEMQAIRREQTEVTPLFWEVVDYQFGWNLDDPVARKKASGKKARPLLMALVAKAICGGYQHVLAAGAALEMLHNFTLIHDDVMDNSPERRHRPAVWTKWGKWQAINCGDGLYALANLAGTRVLERGASADNAVATIRALSQACLWTAEGQILDMDFEARETVSTEEYVTMVSHKSGTLIEAAAKIGALLSTDDASVIESYARFARNLGIAFQIRDDYLGVWGDEAKTGKSATSDIREKKKAYPFLVGFELAREADRVTLRRIYAQDDLTEADIAAVLEILGRVGAAQYTDQSAQQYYRRALDYLDKTGIQNETQDLIRQFAAFLVERAY
jgi:geranylgeranyl diphosphate synthase type I